MKEFPALAQSVTRPNEKGMRRRSNTALAVLDPDSESHCFQYCRIMSSVRMTWVRGSSDSDTHTFTTTKRSSSLLRNRSAGRVVEITFDKGLSDQVLGRKDYLFGF